MNFFTDASLPLQLSMRTEGRVGRFRGETLSRCGLDDGVMVGPGSLEAVSELFYRLHAGAIPNEEAYHCCRQTTHQPN